MLRTGGDWENTLQTNFRLMAALLTSGTDGGELLQEGFVSQLSPFRQRIVMCGS
jgi:hypothetical protein